MAKQPLRKTLEERFWGKVVKTRGCWLWKANSIKDKEGNPRYGLIGRGRRGEGSEYAHRVSWELHYGPIPEGMMVLHSCDVGICVRPDHLFLGTQSDNMQDMVRKGRNGKTGPKPGMGAKSKLSTRQLVALRREAASGVRRTLLAAKYGVCEGTVRNILCGFTNQNR